MLSPGIRAASWSRSFSQYGSGTLFFLLPPSRQSLWTTLKQEALFLFCLGKRITPSQFYTETQLTSSVYPHYLLHLQFSNGENLPSCCMLKHCVSTLYVRDSSMLVIQSMQHFTIFYISSYYLLPGMYKLPKVVYPVHL